MDSEQLFTKGFNNGYLLAQYEPGLLNKIIHTVTPRAPFIEGLFSGKEQYDLELEQDKTQLDELRNIRDQSSSRDQELGREI